MTTVNKYPHYPETAEIEAANKLVFLIEDSLNHNSPVLLLLSGGTWIPALEKADFSNLILNSHLKNLTIMALDDRVEIGPNNNFTKIISVPFIDALIKLGAKTISTLPDIDENVDAFGKRIDGSIKKYLSLNSNVIMIATAGIGGESNVPGHIAGIEPIEDQKEFSKNFQDPEIFYFGYVARKLQPELRATATFSLLNKVSHFVLLILNPEQKSRPLNILLSGENIELNNAPCVYFHNHPNTTIYTDI